MLGRIARGGGCLAAGLLGWVIAFAVIAATVVAFSYLLTREPPYFCVAVPGNWRLGLPLSLVPLLGIPGATLLVGLWWVLGSETRRGRVGRLAVVVPAVLVATAVGFLSTLVFLC